MEADMEKPEKSKFFTAFPAFVKDHHAARLCLRHHAHGPDGRGRAVRYRPDDRGRTWTCMPTWREQSVTALSTVADSLPGLGIVAAVLGVVMTMGALGGPPEEIGKKVAAALVGTFLGILMCYGMVGPIAANISKLAPRSTNTCTCCGCR